jgi:hypothetical protein
MRIVWDHRRNEQERKARVWSNVLAGIARDAEAAKGYRPDHSAQAAVLALPPMGRKPMRKKRTGVSGRLFGVVGSMLLIALISAGCKKVTLPASDSTPPVLKWHVIPVSGPTQVITGTGMISANIGDTFDVTLTAEDPQGIHEISLASSMAWLCVSRGANQSTGPGLAVPSVQTLWPDGQGSVLTSIFLMRDVSMGPVECQSGYTLASVTVILYGKGENYFNGVTEATLTFKAP